MGFKRIWNATCPRVWDKWEAGGITWVVQDLLPEDDELAVQLMLEQFCPDETLCSSLGIDKDATSLRKMADFWWASVSQRMSLACYNVIGNNKTLAALNVCVVKSMDDGAPNNEQTEMDGFFDLLQTFKYLDSKCDVFEDLRVDKYMYGHGLLVTRQYRGFKLGAKLLAAREPMCLELGLPASVTLFTGAASQKLAARCGFATVLAVPLKHLAANGLRYSEVDERTIKIMTKKYL